MNIKLSITAIAGALAYGICSVTWTAVQSFISTVYANDKSIVEHNIKIATYEQIRPQVQDIMIRMGTIERKIDELLEDKRIGGKNVVRN